MLADPFKEPDMPQQRGKSANTDKQKRQAGASEKGDEQKGAARPQPEARAWPTTDKLLVAGKKFDSRRKIPSGPIGGSGRKTNLSRSS